MEEMKWARFFAEVEPLVNRLTARYAPGFWREEAKQVARIACWQNAHRYDAGRGAKLSTFLFVIVRRALADFYEREALWRSRHLLPVSGDEEGPGWEETLMAVEKPMEEALVWESWMVLVSDTEAACLTLHIRDGLPLRDVAMCLGMTYEAVKKQKQRALARLRTRLSPQGLSSFLPKEI
ncbi:RNA polymerase sigma factor (sigma-70 family) [Aneurinibacillus soli]|uniref:RNA polymerase sigma factor SigK n=1 Tax=Aneurinibacillus soli TaxID=1500254 RepID=A0A0U5B4E2_9BACL|nr:sigma-70 family RNA polymerase sigma factor [Aneurinibacillus soli]PYE61511.1 RNA polymerase sigma factor (sigma-70 family) [Aneurinibacillus soli]BAU26534.1 RNA polymerase sigma factor SigK [Aneurinibacillus soli]